MKRIFDDLISSKEWLIEQNQWEPPKQRPREAHFTIGNGMIGSRGVLEELPLEAIPGTYVAGIFDSFGAQIPEMVNLPNPFVFRVDVGGEKIAPDAMDVVSHYRALDMKKGLLVRHTRYKTAHKKVIDYQSYRFISRYQKYLGVMVVSITPQTTAMNFNVSSILDTAVFNRGVFTEGHKRHFEVTNISKEKNATYTEIQTLEHQHVIGYATCIEVIQKNRRKVKDQRTFKVKIRKGETVTFIRYFTLVPAFYCRTKKVKKLALSELARGRKLGLKRLFQAHEREWHERWKKADFIIRGDEFAQKALRFNLYHLLIAGHPDGRVSVGARTLSGEGYRGHIFWDAETFVFPFFLFIHPRVAKSMLMYRWHRLDPARKIAAAKGYKGVLFPWESADTGEETTPSWYKSMDGQIFRIETMNEEHHLVADIAYAVNQYAEATGDEEFMSGHGLELLIETARFWASRVTYNKKKRHYEIRHAMGPDEFHSGINNNAFTNELARFNLNISLKWCHWVKERHHKKWIKLAKKLKFIARELTTWKKIADKIYIPYSKKKKIIESFEGYLKLKDVRITQLDQNFMPIIPPQATPVENGKTQLIKQADVVMLNYLLPHKYSLSEIKRNYRYYERRCLHKSSLSSSIYAAVAARLGDEEKALHYLSIALQADLLDVHGNAWEGFHAASGGGIWQALVMGFGGMSLAENRIIFNPCLPELWQLMSFHIQFRGSLLRIEVKKKEVRITQLTQGKQKNISIEVKGIRRNLQLKKTAIFLY